MRARIAKWSERDDGAVAVIVALLLVIFIGLAAFVVDAGYWYNVRRQLQSAADSGALAGCAELKLSGDKTAAFTKATQYASLNATAPADGLEVMPIGTSTTSSMVGDDYVLLTVRKKAPTFFCSIYGGTNGYIVAQSKAKLSWVYGMRGLVPLAMPILAAPTRATATLNGVVYEMQNLGHGVWRAYGVAAGTAASTTGSRMSISVYNSVGVPTIIEDAARVVVKPSGCPVTDIMFSTCFIESGDPSGIDITIASGTRPTELAVGRTRYTAGKFTSTAAGVWSIHVDAPSTPEIQESFPVHLTVADPAGGRDYTLSNVATIVARRATFPVGSVSLDRMIVGSGQVVDVTLNLADYEYGEQYEMKVTGASGQTGDYMALDFSRIYHSGETEPEYEVGNGGAETYRQYLGEPFPHVVHIGDIIWTQTGELAGPTGQGLRTRIGSDSCTWSQWSNPATSHGRRCPHLVYVPVVEFFDNAPTSQGRQLIVVNFATFFVDGYAMRAGNEVVTGRFVEYVSAGDILGEGQPPVFGVQAPRLVSDGVSF